MTRRYPIGAEPLPEGGVSFRLWAPRCRQVDVVLPGGTWPLTAEQNGYFSGIVPSARTGDLYRFRLDAGQAFPDPASRFQPEGPHGPSQVIDPAGFQWTDAAWSGVTLEGQVLYEMHIGTFTREGTWDAARRELAELSRLGITIVELMPVADFPGRFGWGYDGVGLFAPVAIYGAPDDFRSFVDEAHRFGIGVILDVVYNHIGPDGNYLKFFSEDYFTDRYQNEWGEAINYDGPNSAPVREWVTTNSAYWADEFHLDGLRLDATQQIFDASPENIMTALARSIRAAARGRGIVIFAENESQHTRLARPVEQGGLGLDGLWNDDFHHTARVAATGHDDAYYSDYSGRPQELISAVKYGYLYQGQRYAWQAKRRGTPAWGLLPAQFLNYIQNHDQVANTPRGARLDRLTSPGRLRALTALLLLAPGTPLLFQGQEFAASTPFYYFADHNSELRPLVQEGRIQFLSQFRAMALLEMRPLLPDPGDPATFDRSKLDLRERETHHEIYQLHQDLLRLRREDPVFRVQTSHHLDGAVLANEALLLRYFGPSGDDRLLIVNFGGDLKFSSFPEPLLAPPENRLWEVQWSSENPAYGGNGTPPPEDGEGWRIPGHAALVLRPAQPTQTWQI